MFALPVYYSLLIMSSDCMIKILFHTLTRVRFYLFMITRITLPTTMHLTMLYVAEIPSLL